MYCDVCSTHTFVHNLSYTVLPLTKEGGPRCSQRILANTCECEDSAFYMLCVQDSRKESIHRLVHAYIHKFTHIIYDIVP